MYDTVVHDQENTRITLAQWEINNAGDNHAWLQIMHSVLKIAVCYPCVISHQMVERAQDVFCYIRRIHIKIC